MKDIALVLSSGGARGLAHIGVIEELESRGYHITSIAGCSMGALIGGVYAAGKLTEFREWMKTIDRKKMLELTDFSLYRSLDIFQQIDASFKADAEAHCRVEDRHLCTLFGGE